MKDAYNLVAMTEKGESASIDTVLMPFKTREAIATRIQRLCRFGDLQMSMRPTSGPIDHLDHALHQRAWLWAQMGDRETV